jgi:hypothetical protein
LVCGAFAVEAECVEVEGDGESEKESAECVVEGFVMEAEVLGEDRKAVAGGEAEASDDQEAVRFGAEVSAGEAHGGFSFAVSVVEPVPEHHGHFDYRHGEDYGKEVPTDLVVDD